MSDELDVWHTPKRPFILSVRSNLAPRQQETRNEHSGQLRNPGTNRDHPGSRSRCLLGHGDVHGGCRRQLGSYIFKLPVNQSFTCEAGVKIWGFPKTVEELDFSYADDSATCKLSMGGQYVLTLTVPRGGDGSTPESAAIGYTMIEGIPHQNEFVRGGTGEQTLPGGEGVRLVLGDHPIADELRSLGVESATPLLSAWTEHMTGSFGKSVKL